VVAHFQEMLLRRLLLDDTPQVRPAELCPCAPRGAPSARRGPARAVPHRRLPCTQHSPPARPLCPPQDAVELASDALLPLLLAEPSAFQPLSSVLSAAAAAPGGGGRGPEAVAGALGGLGAWLGARAAGDAGGEAGGGLSRGLQRDFRQRMCQLVSDVRAFTKVR
jgi:hypothetical protein